MTEELCANCGRLKAVYGNEPGNRCMRAIGNAGAAAECDDTAHERAKAARRPLTYLACPYSHPDRVKRLLRFDAACRAAANLMTRGHKVFSPISQTHPIAEVARLPRDWQFWAEFCRAYLSCSKQVVVLCLDGWRESRGVTAEIDIARELGIPVEYMSATAHTLTTEPP